jgi:hypothetical protein
VLELEQRTGQYRRVSPDKPQEFEVNSYFGINTSLQDVYVTAPRLDFALFHRLVRYQIANSLSTLSSSKNFLCLMDNAVYKVGLTRDDCFAPLVDWVQSQSNPDVRLAPPLRLWHHYNNASVIYRNRETSETFTVVIGTSKEFCSEPQAFLAGIMDNIGKDITAAEIQHNVFKEKRHSLTDLSTKMLVKHLDFGKQVILSVNVTQQQADESTGNVAWFQNFRLWVVVKESGI